MALRPSRLQYRAQVGGPTGSVVEPSYTSSMAQLGNGPRTLGGGRPALVLLAALVVGLAAFAYWTR